MSQDQIKLPEPDGHAWGRNLSNARGVYWEDPAIYGVDVTHPEYSWEGIYKATTVRRLIAEAVAAERAKNIAALEALNLWDYDDPASSAIAAIQGDQT